MVWFRMNLWNFVRRTKTYVVVASSVFRTNRMIGLLPKFITKTEHGEYIIDEKPSSVWPMYLSFILLHGSVSAMIIYRIITRVPLISIAYFLSRILIAAVIHISFMRRYQEMHASLKDIQRLAVKAPVYWSFIPYGLNSISALLTAYGLFLISGSLGTFLLRWATFMIPTLIVSNSCCLICSKVVALTKAIKTLNANISLLLRRPRNFDLRPIISRGVQIRAACAFLNEAYADPMFLIIAYVFLDMTFALFVAATFEGWTSPAFIFIAKSLSHVFPPLALMHVCQEAEAAFQETKMLSANIKTAENFPQNIDDYDQVYEWHIHLQQLPVQFNAKGFCKVNREIVRVVVSTVVSYTVILMQNFKIKH